MKNDDLQQLENVIFTLSRLLGKFEQQNETFLESKKDYSNKRIIVTVPDLPGWKLIKHKKEVDLKDSQILPVPNNLGMEEKELKYLSLRKDGRWQARKIIDGKRVCFYGATQLEAKNKLINYQRQTKKTVKKIYTFYEFCIYWLDEYKKNNVVETTYKNYKYTINAHLKINKPINKVIISDLQEIINKLPQTRIREEVHKIIIQVTKKAFELDLIKKDFGQFLVKGKLINNKREALNIEEQYKLIDSLKDDVFSHRVIFYLCTGSRPSEIKTIDLHEVKKGWLLINGSKTKNAKRWVKISDDFYNMIIKQPKNFFNFDLKRFREKLQKHCEKIGIKKDVTVYTLRHTFATNLYILRIPEKDRQYYMGHSIGSRLTNEVYTTFTPDTNYKDIYNIYGSWYPIFD